MMFNNTRVIAFLITSISFVVVLSLFRPLLYSTDDGYLLYTLAGGFGEPPSNLLHYDHIWHPWLGWLIKNLFTIYPGWNWYSGFLILVHGIASVVIIYVLLERIRKEYALLYSLIFLLFESLFLLQLSFTNASLILSVASCVYLFHFFSRQKKLSRSWTVFILFLIAGMLRIHTLAFIIVLFLPVFVFLLPRNVLLKIAGWFLALGLCIICLNLVHKAYYKKHIPNWSKEEDYRKSFFSIVNKPGRDAEGFTLAMNDSVERSFFRRVFLYDSSVFSQQKMMQLAAELGTGRKFQEDRDLNELYWIFIESRMFIGLFVLMALVCVITRYYRLLRILLVVFAWAALILGYLFVFQKITTVIFIGGFIAVYLQAVLLSPASHELRGWRWLLAGGFAVVILMTANRIYRTNDANKGYAERFTCNMEVLRTHPDQLFIASDFRFPIGLSPIWITPKNYPAKNIVYGGMFITRSFQPTLDRFAVKDLLRDLYSRKELFLLGANFPELREYYLKRWNVETKLSDPLPGYGCAEVRQLSAK